MGGGELEKCSERVRVPRQTGTEGCRSLVGNVIEPDAVGRQFEPCLTTGCACTATPLWSGLGCRSLNRRGLIKLRRSLAYVLSGFRDRQARHGWAEDREGIRGGVQVRGGRGIIMDL